MWYMWQTEKYHKKRIILAGDMSRTIMCRMGRWSLAHDGIHDRKTGNGSIGLGLLYRSERKEHQWDPRSSWRCVCGFECRTGTGDIVRSLTDNPIINNPGDRAEAVHMRVGACCLWTGSRAYWNFWNSHRRTDGRTETSGAMCSAEW